MTETLYEKVRHFFPPQAQRALQKLFSAPDANQHEYAIHKTEDMDLLTETYNNISSVIDLQNKTITIQRRDGAALAAFSFAQNPKINLAVIDSNVPACRIGDTLTEVYRQGNLWRMGKMTYSPSSFSTILNTMGQRYGLNKSGFMGLAKVCVGLPEEVNVPFLFKKRGEETK